VAELTENQKIFLQLVGRSMKDRDWATVSDALWNHTKTMHSQIPDLVELDGPNQRVRPTDEGKVLLKWL
jgi:hypothetical protein